MRRSAAKKLTFYGAQFADGFTPEVWFLVRREQREKAVNDALAAWQKGRAGRAVRARALTFDRAAAELLPAIGKPVPSARLDRDDLPTGEGAPPSPLLLSRAEADLLVRYCTQSAQAIQNAGTRYAVCCPR